MGGEAGKEGGGRAGEAGAVLPRGNFLFKLWEWCCPCLSGLTQEKGLCLTVLCRHMGLKGQGIMGSLTVRAGRGL